MNAPTTGTYSDFVTVAVYPADPGTPPVQETVRYDQFVRWLFKGDTKPMMALHAALGVCGEVGELIEADSSGLMKDVIEECGDLEFYLQAVRNHYEISYLQLTDFSISRFTDVRAAIHLVVAAGELADCVKREYIYGKPRELEKILAALDKLDNALRVFRPQPRIHILQANANKLSKRYSSLRYSDADAIKRADKAAPDNQD